MVRGRQTDRQTDGRTERRYPFPHFAERAWDFNLTLSFHFHKLEGRRWGRGGEWRGGVAVVRLAISLGIENVTKTRKVSYTFKDIYIYIYNV